MVIRFCKRGGMFTAIVGATICMYSAVFGLEIAGPERCDEHQLVRMELLGESESCSWLVLGEGMTLVDLESAADGRKCVFTGPPGRYVVVAIASQGGRIAQGQKLLEIGRSKPIPPGPSPVPPNPPPVPEFPMGRFGLARDAYVWLGQVQGNRELSLPIAANFERVANGIRGDGAGSQTITDADSARRLIRTWNKEVLGGPEDMRFKHWLPWLEAWTKRVEALDGEGKIDWPAGVEAVFRETSVGLRGTAQ